MDETSLVDGRTPAAAAAELGSVVREAADDAGLEIGPVTVGVDSAAAPVAAATPAASAAGPGRYVRVRASAEATGSLGAVTALLEELETGTRTLRVREFALDPAAPGYVPGVPPGAEPPSVRLRVRVVVEGIARRAGRPRGQYLTQEAR